MMLALELAHIGMLARLAVTTIKRLDMRYQIILFASCVRFSTAFVPQLPQSSSLIARSALTSDDDERFLKLAIDCAKHGLGHTFPNPAVGCVLVRDDTKEVIGQGFHPRAGYPHAEVFALLQAAQHVPDGVALAKGVVNRNDDDALLKVADEFTRKYAEEMGPQTMFQDCLLVGNDETPMVTAYVTLEPCCHHGKTPPCAASLVLAKPSRVVIGFRDPNPRVDGGGVKLLENAGIPVVMAEGALQKACSDLVTNFVKRITPRPEIAGYEHVNGAMRSALRSLAARKKQNGSMTKVTWGASSVDVDVAQDEQEQAVDSLELPPKWMEHVDSVLWSQELVLLQLNKAVKRKKLVQRLGERIAKELQAHVAQTVGHTVLLYRPGIPAKLDLVALVAAVADRDPVEQ
ncbi:hypothetical protein MPSEU_001015400 [Mayamaea pseudoterrestris]|nr:hypothetical protein MPSEU_001015400 [Mayamaea pseudoterrestris]